MIPTNLPKSDLAQTLTAFRRIQILRISAILVLAGLLTGSQKQGLPEMKLRHL